MKKSVVLIFAVMVAVIGCEARGELGAFDFSVGTAGRTYPVSAVLQAEGGYGIPLWGTPRGPFGGYLRPRFFAATAFTYNSLDVALEFFPLGILGFRAGAEAVQNDARFLSYDCASYRCTGRFVHPYLALEATVGAGAYFARLGLRRESWALASGETVDRGVYASGMFLEPTSGLGLRGTGDAQNVMSLLGGVKVDERWTALLLLTMTSADSGGFSRTKLAALAYSGLSGGWTAGVGLGSFESTIQPLGFTVSFFANWEIWPSLRLR